MAARGYLKGAWLKPARSVFGRVSLVDSQPLNLCVAPVLTDGRLRQRVVGRRYGR
jgi:hypothetical protein